MWLFIRVDLFASWSSGWRWKIWYWCILGRGWGRYFLEHTDIYIGLEGRDT